MNAPTVDRPRPARRREAAAGAAMAVAVAVLVGAVGVAGGSGEDDGPPAAAATSAPATPSPRAVPGTGSPASSSVPAPPAPESTAPDPTGAAGAVDGLPTALPAVALDAPASGEDGTRADVVSLEAIDVSGTGVGNIAGPALRVTVRLTGGTEPVALELVGVTLTHGADDVPASPLDDPSSAPFGGRLEPGATAEGTYVFTVPEDDRELVTLTVGYRAGAPLLVFRGPVD